MKADKPIDTAKQFTDLHITGVPCHLKEKLELIKDKKGIGLSSIVKNLLSDYVKAELG
jgi:hypothetical protein